jgi:phosphoribosylformylglycinamidine cyclo-ligase
VVAAEDVAAVTDALIAAGETVHTIGTIAPGERGCSVAGSAGIWSARSAWQAVHNG